MYLHFIISSGEKKAVRGKETICGFTGFYFLDFYYSTAKPISFSYFTGDENAGENNPAIRIPNQQGNVKVWLRFPNLLRECSILVFFSKIKGGPWTGIDRLAVITELLSLQVEELYETYCIQWRLCQGAVNMKRAFSLSPSTRASRESLLELNRNYRHSLQVLQHLAGAPQLADTLCQGEY